MYCQQPTVYNLALFPGPTQLSHCTESDGKLGGAWERGSQLSWEHVAICGSYCLCAEVQLWCNQQMTWAEQEYHLEWSEHIVHIHMYIKWWACSKNTTLTNFKGNTMGMKGHLLICEHRRILVLCLGGLDTRLQEGFLLNTTRISVTHTHTHTHAFLHFLGYECIVWGVTLL